MVESVEALLTGLNPAQQQAVRHVDGPLLVLAGPGSGKTKVITHRIAYLIQHAGIPASQILAVTFTNKAADEMRRRLERLVDGAKPWTCTFHRCCARILREVAPKCGLSPYFSIIDQRERLQLITNIVKQLDLDIHHFPPDRFDKRISHLKNQLLSPHEYEIQAVEYFEKLVAQVYPRYQDQLLAQNLVDFDDLLYLVAQLLRHDEAVRTQLDQRFRYILVDEYQDTNLAQYAIARALSVNYPNLCVTGDPDQSIYSWRGADLRNILHFEEDFPDAVVVRLEQNYRSTGYILASADELIRHNRQRKQKSLITEKDVGNMVAVVCHKDDVSEAQFVADSIRREVDEGRRKYQEFAVFVRVNSLTRTFEQAFRTRYIPFQVIGGTSFFQRKEIRDIVAYARLLFNPKDDSAFLRVINTPPRGLGSVTLDRLQQFARKENLSLIEACLQAGENRSAIGIRGKQFAALCDFGNLYHELQKVIQQSPAEALEQILLVTKYDKVLQDCPPEEQTERMENLQDMIESARIFGQENPTATFLEYLEAASLISDVDRHDSSSDLVSLMTLHAAKGLEFPVVFLVAFEDGILPHERAVQEGNDEEERRLAFVGITRAMEELTISYTRRRVFQGYTIVPAPSKFLLELPREALHRQDMVYANVDSDSHAVHDPCPDDYSQEHPLIEPPSIQVVRRSQGASLTDRFRRDMVVRHPEYGLGKVIELDGVGKQRRATIRFETGTVKKFMLANAQLEPCEAC